MQGKKLLKPCKWLLVFSNGLTSCRVYNHRNFLIEQGNNLVIDTLENGQPVICIPRKMDRFDHPKCEYNIGTATFESYFERLNVIEPERHKLLMTKTEARC